MSVKKKRVERREIMDIMKCQGKEERENQERLIETNEEMLAKVVPASV